MACKEEYDEILFKAYLSDIAERYEDMAEEMTIAVKETYEKKQLLTPNARNSFSVAYKNLVSARRSSWRILCSEKQKLEAKGSNNICFVEEKIAKIEKELLKYCDEVLEMIDNYILVPDDKINITNEYSIFFLKMKGDYYRYKAEVLSDEEYEKTADLAHKAYKEATVKAETLYFTNPIKLGLALNYSVFYYEILNNPKEACNIAKTSFNNAIQHLDNLEDDCYRDSTLIMQLLRDNLTLWSSREDNIRMTDDDRTEVTECDEN